MANQVIVTNTGNVQVALTPPPNVQVQISRAAIGTVSNVPTANFANYAANVTASNQPNITSVGILANLTSTGTATFGNIVVTGNLSVGNLFANNANYSNFAGQVVDNTQSNITSLGTLTSLSVSGNITGANANLGNLVTANFFSGDGSLLSNVNGSNVSNVANANYANFAGTAYSVAGANVTGVVANANYSAYANIAASANSVAVANVSGIGNIATTNFNGNGSQALLGNGVFGAVSSITVAGSNTQIQYNNNGNLGANSYFTFDTPTTTLNVGSSTDQVYPGTINVKAKGVIGASTGTIAITPNGISRTTAFSFPANANISGFNVISYGAGPNNITLTSDGNATIGNNFTVTGNANVGNLGTTRVIATGNISATQLISNISTGTAPLIVTSTTEVANLNVATAGLAAFATTANSVAGANVSGEVANANYSSYANIAATANSVALANVVGIGNIANINLDGSSSNVLFGNGVFAPESTSIANANYANFAGDVVNSTQSNITSLGNLTGLTINNTVGTAPTLIFAPNGTSFTTNYAPSAGTTQLGQSSRSGTGTPANAIIRTRGTISSPLTVGTSDTVNFNTYYAYNGNTNALAASYIVRLGGSGTLNTGANAVYTGASHLWQTGNPWGDWSNISAVSGLNTLTFNSQGSLSITPGARRTSGTSTGLLSLTDYGTPTGAEFASGIFQTKARGNADGALSVEPNDEIGAQTFNPVNGNATATIPSQIVVKVDGSYTANSAYVPMNILLQPTTNTNTRSTTSFYGNGLTNFPGNIIASNANLGNLAVASFFSGDGGLLSNITGANITGTVANATFALDAGNSNLANTANSVAVANVSGIGNIAVINLDGSSSNVLFGNGIFAPESTSIANANYANFAGTVITNAQPNITSVGNLPYLQVSNSANSISVITQLASNAFPIVSSFANLATYLLTTHYHPNNSLSYPADRTIRSRGNVTNPTTAVTGDRIYQKNGLVYNGNTNVISVSEIFTAVGTVSNIANGAYTGGQWDMTTGNPGGDTANANNASWQNTLTFSNSGTLSITPGTPANTSLGQTQSSIVITNYGTSTTDLVNVGGIAQARARGNRANVQSVQPGDQVGRTIFYCYSNGAFQTSNVAQSRVVVDSTYVANHVIVPMSHQFQTVANVGGVATFRTTSLYANGLTQLPGNINFSGSSANLITTGNGSIALGSSAGLTNQGVQSLAVGFSAGEANQGSYALSFGDHAGANAQSQYAVAIGQYAGANLQGNNSVAFGTNAGGQAQGNTAVAIGSGTGQTNQGVSAIAIGPSAGQTSQGNSAVAIGASAGITGQGVEAVAIGQQAGQTNQANSAVAIGIRAGGNAQAITAVAIGADAGSNAQGQYTVAIGENAGANTQGEFSVAAGVRAGYNNQGVQSVALGYYAGANTQGQYSVAIGRQAGEFTQGSNSFALGYAAASNNQGNNSIAFGWAAGLNTQGSYAIAIGARAGDTNQANNSIILNATGSVLDQTTANTFTVKPVRNANTANVMFYNSSTGEITYDTLANNTSNVSAANVTINSGGFMKLASYTEAALTAITGQIGWMAAVSDSAQGSNPNGMIAFWDTTNSRWSYIHDNSAV